MIDDFVVEARTYMISLLDFINFISQTDDIQDVTACTVGGEVDLLASVGRPTAPTPLVPVLPAKSGSLLLAFAKWRNVA